MTASKTRHNDRLERFYVEAAAQPVNLQAMCADAMAVIQSLLDNLGARIEAAMAKGEPMPAPLLDELSSIARTLSTLEDLRRNGPCDDDAGAKEICRILELGRKEYRNGETEANTIKAHPGEEGAGSEPDETRQNPTPQEGTDTSARESYQPTTHGKVRR